MPAPDELLDLKGLGLKYCCGFLYCARKGEPIKEKVANGIAYPISLRQRPPTVAGCGGTTNRAELEMTAVPSTSTPPSGTTWRAVSSFRGIKKTRVGWGTRVFVEAPSPSGNLADAGDGERVDHQSKVVRGREWPRWFDGRTLVSSVPHPGVV